MSEASRTSAQTQLCATPNDANVNHAKNREVERKIVILSQAERIHKKCLIMANWVWEVAVTEKTGFVTSRF